MGIFQSALLGSISPVLTYSRDKRPDCVQVVIALIVTPQGFPLAYEVMPGNTTDKTTLADFLERIESQYGRSERVWIMDRGIPTEETLSSMRTGDPVVRYLVGTPKGRLTRLEKAFVGLPWREVRESVEVKLLAEDGELYILAQSRARIAKERGMRRRRLKRLWRRLHELRGQSLERDELLLKLGAAKKEAGRAYNLVEIRLPAADEAVTPETFGFALRRDRLRRARRREGGYLLRSNLTGEDPPRCGGTTRGSPRSSRRSRNSSTTSPSSTENQWVADVSAPSCGSRASVASEADACGGTSSLFERPGFGVGAMLSRPQGAPSPTLAVDHGEYCNATITAAHTALRWATASQTPERPQGNRDPPG